MYTYSKKSRRRMHAIPAAIALSLLALLWFFSDSRHVEAAEIDSTPIASTVLLSAGSVDDWSVDCDDCRLEAQYDVILGDVLRLQSRSEMVVSLDIDNSVKSPQLSWRWTVDSFVENNALLRLTVNVDETDTWPERTLHYIWDSGRDAGETDTLSDFEHLVVVNGKRSKAEDWQQVVCHLEKDWQRIYNESFPKIESLEFALGMPGKLAVSGAFIEQLSMTSVPYVPEPQQLEETSGTINEELVQQAVETDVAIEQLSMTSVPYVGESQQLEETSDNISEGLAQQVVETDVATEQTDDNIDADIAATASAEQL